MHEPPNKSSGSGFWQRTNDDPVKIIGMAVLVAFCCALLVSLAEHLLMPKRLANIEAQRQAKMATMLAALPGLESVLQESGADSLQTHIVELDTGQIATGIDASGYDQQLAAKDPAMSTELPPEIDIAGIGRRANFAPVNLLYRDDELLLVILPVHGTGYQSIIRAWLALAGDLNTVKAFTVIEQGETPGLGARIEEPRWLAQFNGKQLQDASGTQRLTVVKGKSGTSFEIDGISGATRTGNAINNLLSFWLGDTGFGPFLDTLANTQ